MSTVYFKATRPDGTDFCTGSILYEVGKRVRPHPYGGARNICGPGLLHAAAAPAMTLVGGTWPCRLFEVTGTPTVGFDERHVHKGGFKQLTVVREIDAHLALGPNGKYVAGIIERTRAMTYEEATELRAAWDAARNAARNAAWYAARDAAWYAARDAARGAAWGAALATLVRDLITTEQFDVIYRPWAKVIEGKR